MSADYFKFLQASNTLGTAKKTPAARECTMWVITSSSTSVACATLLIKVLCHVLCSSNVLAKKIYIFKLFLASLNKSLKPKSNWISNGSWNTFLGSKHVICKNLESLVELTMVVWASVADFCASSCIRITAVVKINSESLESSYRHPSFHAHTLYAQISIVNHHGFCSLNISHLSSCNLTPFPSGQDVNWALCFWKAKWWDHVNKRCSRCMVGIIASF